MMQANERGLAGRPFAQPGIEPLQGLRIQLSVIDPLGDCGHHRVEQEEERATHLDGLVERAAFVGEPQPATELGPVVVVAGKHQEGRWAGPVGQHRTCFGVLLGGAVIGDVHADGYSRRMPSDPPIGTPATADQPLAPSLRACLWFDRQAEEAVTFYCDLVPNSRVHEVMRCGPDGPLPEGEVLTAIFTLAGVECMALNGGPMFTLSEAFSFVLECDGQAEIDRYWEALTADGGQESQCGWCKDRFGLKQGYRESRVNGS